jgi:hypothetical protein
MAYVHVLTCGVTAVSGNSIYGNCNLQISVSNRFGGLCAAYQVGE